MLDVVQHDEQLAAGERVREVLGRRYPRRLAYAARGGDGARDLLVVSEAGELDEDDAVRDAIGDVLGHGAREPRLARAAGTRDGDEPVGFEQRRDLGALARSPDQRRGPRRRHRAPDGAQRLERGRQIGMAELIDPFPSVEAVEPDRLALDQARAAGDRIAHHLARGRRHQHLRAVREAAQARTTDERRTVVASGYAQLGLARMDGHAHPHRSTVGPGLRGQRPLGVQRRRQRVAGARERRHRGVALALLDRRMPAVSGDGGRDQLALARHHVRGARGLPPETRRRLDVGQEKRDHPGRQRRGPPRGVLPWGHRPGP